MPYKDKEARVAYFKKYQKEYKDKNKVSISVKAKNRNDYKRFQCLSYYSSGKIECAECGLWENPEALCIDHINNDGAEHRKLICRDNSNKQSGAGIRLYTILINNNFPPGYQVLCYNCNWTKEIYRRRDSHPSTRF